MRRAVRIALLALLAGYVLLSVVLYVAVGPDWGRQSGQAINRAVKETDWRQAGEQAADDLAHWLTGR